VQKKMIACLVVGLLLFTMAFVATGCPAPVADPAPEPGEEPAAPEPGEEAAEKLEFAYITAGDLVHPFIAVVTKGWDDAVAKLGVESTTSLAHYDFAQVVSLVDAAIAADVDGIFIFNWYEPEGLAPSIQRALDNDIEVVTMSIKYGFTPAEVPFIGADYEIQGFEIGQHLAEELKAIGKTTDVNIAVFPCYIGTPIMIERNAGVLRGLTEAGIEFTSGEFEATSDPAKAVDVITAFMIAHPETDAIVGTSAVPTSAGFHVLRDLGYEPGEILWTGVDLVPDTKEGIEAGFGSVNVDEIWSYGFKAAMVLYMRAAHGATVGDVGIYTAMVGKENLHEFLWLLEP